MIELRPVAEDDLETFHEYEADPVAAERAVWTPRDWPAFHEHWHRIMANPDVILRTVVVDGAIAGNVMSWTQDGRRDVGYWIGRAFWGRGVATAALRAFLDVDRHRPLHADPFASNAASVAVLRKCGFTETGRDGAQVVLVKAG